ncbi:MAG TPA: retropepsin-like aspartic protease, partial [Candidatus Baltobacteraceae bacterium]|nr:retropepsin-like aspartic protease [Candidatus Baltobacteraceae bacterium]
MNRTPHAILALVFLAFTAMTSARPASPPAPSSDISAPFQIPAEFTDVGIIVPVMVKGRRLDFVLDSGASRVSIDQRVAAQLGLGAADYRKSTGKGTDWSQGHSQIDEIGVGGYVQKNLNVWTVDFQHENVDKRVVGLLGWQFFTGHRVDINFKDKTVTLLPEDSATPDPKVWTALDIDTRFNVPLIHAQFNAIDGRFIIDTGSFKTILYEHYFEHFHPKGQAVVQGKVVGITNHERDYKM